MLDTRNLTKRRPPALPYAELASQVLGPKYDLSLVFVGSARSRALNLKLRGKDHAANVLSFPYDKNSGEIVIDLTKAAKEAVIGDESLSERVAVLFIHGLYHLKGFLHGSKMETAEAKVLRSLRLNAQSDRHRP